MIIYVVLFEYFNKVELKWLNDCEIYVNDKESADKTYKDLLNDSDYRNVWIRCADYTNIPV